MIFYPQRLPHAHSHHARRPGFARRHTNRNPLETHQNLVEDPFQMSVDNFYKRINALNRKYRYKDNSVYGRLKSRLY